MRKMRFYTRIKWGSPLEFHRKPLSCLLLNCQWSHVHRDHISQYYIYIYVISISSYYSLISHYIHWLVVWHMFFHSVGNVIIPTDELIFFSEGWAQPPTRYSNAQTDRTVGWKNMTDMIELPFWLHTFWHLNLWLSIWQPGHLFLNVSINREPACEYHKTPIWIWVNSQYW